MYLTLINLSKKGKTVLVAVKSTASVTTLSKEFYDLKEECLACILSREYQLDHVEKMFCVRN
jgi:hypothetical protein